MKKTFTSKSEKETLKIAEKIASELFLEEKVFIELKGTLGAGKSTFARGFILEWLKKSREALPKAITSPTFTLVQTYGNKRRLSHLDLYRIESVKELEAIGYEQYFFEYSCCIVEWLEKIPEIRDKLAPQKRFQIEIQMGKKETERVITYLKL